MRGALNPRRVCYVSYADHPRVCGEHPGDLSCIPPEPGSSPRMRGALSRLNKLCALRRIIPAYAGSTRYVNAFNHRFWDHPRVCGEHSKHPIGIAIGKGSSPRMRGAHIIANAWYIVIGIIPAYAGSTLRGKSCMGMGRDHPRVCGEHSAGESNANETAGSSPRMRGALESSSQNGNIKGIIPAYAGSTLLPRQHGRAVRDHPRVCGEHLTKLEFDLLYQGSSPRMRGALVNALQPYKLSGSSGGEVGNHRKRSGADGLREPFLHGAPNLARLDGVEQVVAFPCEREDIAA